MEMKHTFIPLIEEHAKTNNVVILANKCDIPVSQRQVTADHGKTLCTKIKGRPALFFEVSAADINVKQSVDAGVAEFVRQQSPGKLVENEDITVSLGPEPTGNSCCVLF